jgi:DNA-binding LacI/PurR family transcriptional regulator
MPQRKTGKRRATIGDVARLAGVSKATVSRVLNGSDLVTPQTREQVEKAMDEADYSVSWQAQTLATGRSDAIAILVTEPFAVMWSDPTFASILQGVYAGLATTTRMPILLHASSAEEQMKARRLLDRRIVDGVIHLTPYEDHELLAHLERAQMPTVLCGRLPGDPFEGRFSTVYADDEIGAALAARHLRRMDRTQPVALLGPEENPATADRLSGYRMVLGEALAEDRVRYGSWDEHGGSQMAESLLADIPEVDALLCGSDRIAAGALSVLRQRGLTVPEDIAVIGFDDHPLAAHTDPPLTTIAQPMKGEGETAVELVLKLIDGAQPRTVVLPMELVQRASA